MNAKTMTDLVAEHRDASAAIAQRIGEQNAVINQLEAGRTNDEHLLRQALSQIIALNSELNNALGVDQTMNVVALMIEERLKIHRISPLLRIDTDGRDVTNIHGLHDESDTIVSPVEWEDITDPDYVLQADDELNSKWNDKDSPGGWLSCDEMGLNGDTVGKVGDWCWVRRRKPISPAVPVPAVVPNDYPSPFSKPFTNPRSGMGIRKDQNRCQKCGKDLDFDGDCDFCDGFVSFRTPPDDSQSQFSDLPL